MVQHELVDPEVSGSPKVSLREVSEPSVPVIIVRLLFYLKRQVDTFGLQCIYCVTSILCMNFWIN